MSFYEICDYQNLLRAGLECCNGGRWKRSTQTFEMSLLEQVSKKREELLDGTYKPSKTKNFIIHERGKERQIKAHNINDRMVYKSFCEHELWPAIKDLLIRNNFASQKGKGTDFAIKTFKHDIDYAYKTYGTRDFYITIFDFHDYFGSIPHNLAYDLIAPRLSDDRSRKLLQQYMDIFPGGIGVGIGGEPSQIIAITYPAPLDFEISQDQRVLSYGRYMDDSYFITRTKQDAREVADKFRKIANNLKLVINEKHSKAYWMEKDMVTYLKKRTFISETGKIVMCLTKKNVTNELRRLRKQHKEYEKGVIPFQVIKQSFQCWCSYARKYDNYHSLVTVTDLYCKLFNIPWKEAREAWKPRKKSKLNNKNT